MQCFGELLLLGAKVPDPLTLLLLLEACLFLLAIRFLLLLAPGLGHLGLTLLDHGLDRLELTVFLLSHGVVLSLGTLLVLIEHLLDELAIVHLLLATGLQFLDLLAASFLFEQLTLKISKLVKLILLEQNGFFELSLLGVHLSKLLSVLLLELLAEGLHLLAVLLLHLAVQMGDQAIGQVGLEDVLLLLQLLFTDLVEVLDLALLGALLHLAHDLGLFASVVILDVAKIILQLGINVRLLLLVLGNLCGLIEARDDGIDTALAVVSGLAELLLLGNLLLHHGQYLFL